MHDAGRVGLIELDAAPESVLTRHGEWLIDDGWRLMFERSYVYRMPECWGRKKRGSSASTRSSPCRVQERVCSPASFRSPSASSDANCGANRCRMFTPYLSVK